MAIQDAKRRALGRGLESLLPARLPVQEPEAVTVSAAAEAAPVSEGRPLEIAVELIDRNPYQTRTRFDEAALTELAASIAATGVVQPIVVRPAPDGRYQLIAGERRLLASRQAGKATVPAFVREASNAQTLEMTIVENLQRADLNPMEQARAFQRLSHEFQLTQDQMAQRTGKERASVANFLRLLRLPEAVQGMVEAGELTFGHARALLALATAEQMMTTAQKVRALSFSVRQTETFVQGLLHPESRSVKEAKPEVAVDANVRAAELTLQRALGLKVQIEDRRGRGRVIIEYSRLEDFDHILQAFGQAHESVGE